MHLKFFIEGDVVPVCYDFRMSLAGVLSPAKSPPMRSHGCVLVVLANVGGGPTEAQVQTIGDLRTINPDWQITQYFETGEMGYACSADAAAASTG